MGAFQLKRYLRARHRGAVGASGLGRCLLLLAGPHVGAADRPALVLGEEDLRLVRVAHDVEAVAEVHHAPVVVEDARGLPGAARAPPGAVVLHPAAQVVEGLRGRPRTPGRTGRRRGCCGTPSSRPGRGSPPPRRPAPATSARGPWDRSRARGSRRGWSARCASRPCRRRARAAAPRRPRTRGPRSWGRRAGRCSRGRGSRRSARRLIFGEGLAAGRRSGTPCPRSTPRGRRPPAGCEGATFTPMRPMSLGRPFSSFFQVRPPSTDFQTPPSSLPLVCVQGLRSKRQSAA